LQHCPQLLHFGVQPGERHFQGADSIRQAESGAGDRGDLSCWCIPLLGAGPQSGKFLGRVKTVGQYHSAAVFGGEIHNQAALHQQSKLPT
jgi:hypothetical protein